MSKESHSLTHLGGEHHVGGESQSVDRVREPPASKIASDAGKAHSYAQGKLNGAGPGAGEKSGPLTGNDEVRSRSSVSSSCAPGRDSLAGPSTHGSVGNTAGSGYVKGGLAPGIA
ncbi:hypothetical protein JCM8208_003019 [Rhodotorula glutinis]